MGPEQLAFRCILARVARAMHDVLGVEIAVGIDMGQTERVPDFVGEQFVARILAHRNLGAENIMHSASNTRQYATEGQLFRAHLNPTSILDAVYNARPGELTRTCS